MWYQTILDSVVNGRAQLWNQLLTLMMHGNNQPFIVFLDLFEIRFHSWEASNASNRIWLRQWSSLRIFFLFFPRQPARGQRRLAWPDRGLQTCATASLAQRGSNQGLSPEGGSHCLKRHSSRPLHISPRWDQSAHCTLKGVCVEGVGV